MKHHSAWDGSARLGSLDGTCSSALSLTSPEPHRTTNARAGGRTGTVDRCVFLLDDGDEWSMTSGVETWRRWLSTPSCIAMSEDDTTHGYWLTRDADGLQHWLCSRIIRRYNDESCLPVFINGLMIVYVAPLSLDSWLCMLRRYRGFTQITIGNIMLCIKRQYEGPPGYKCDANWILIHVKMFWTKWHFRSLGFLLKLYCYPCMRSIIIKVFL